MIGGFNKLQVGTIIVALTLFVLLITCSRQAETTHAEKTQVQQVDPRVQEALDMLDSGAPPMQAIGKLKAIAESEPDNIDAAWHLGLLSIRSGQYDKAIERFGQVIEHDKSGKYEEVQVYLGKTYATMGEKEKARAAFNEFIEQESDTSLTRMVRQLIVELDKTS